ncbi:MAG: hypothetical protein LQ343_002027 [Gyalolechia ehrenbergii]|nr:MAG: hypothetical protein LQ343_002027 [Gyalolechia ehrenbergii]
MFSSLGLFKQTPCPEHPHCPTRNCLFAHNDSPGYKNDSTASRKLSETHSLEIADDTSGYNGPRKRRRVSGGLKKEIELPTPLKSTQQYAVSPKLVKASQKTHIVDETLPRTASRTISPPPLRAAKNIPTKTIASENEGRDKAQLLRNRDAALSPPSIVKKSPLQKAEVVGESLNPRMLPNPPVSHPIRMKLVTMLYEQMIRLNDEVKRSQAEARDALLLSDQALITEALDEEFQVARKSPTVYQNVIKSRIMVLKKMKFEVWKEERIKKLAQKLPDTGQNKPSAPKNIETGLTPAEEIAFLPRLAAKQEGLSKHGYITSMPTAAEVEAAQKGIESSHGWELCDRCKTRFQVFPGRRAEDGALTSGGPCTYHWTRPRRPEMVKGETKRPDLKYACCDETLGASAGCTKAESHVFKISDPKRLALVMPFVVTPVQGQTDLPGAVCFDCEMGYTTYGMELIRLTATAWPDGRELLDVLVHPIGEILDLNSRFSGVWPEEFANAVPYEKDVQPGVASTLQIVDSPSKARDLLLELLTPETPLIGHALENDLNAVRILHPVIVDTCLLYAHPRGLPLRFGLKVLMRKHLGRDIQMGGDQGHDSKEDARAAGDLVRYRIGEMWQKMKGEGWSTRDGDLYPPLPLDTKHE